MSDEQESVKWTVTLGSGEWNTVKYGVVEYLRKRPKMRAVTAVLGLVWVCGWLAQMAGYNWHLGTLPALSAWFITPTLLWLAVVSGPDFRLTFGETKKSDPPATPPETNGVLDPEGYGIEALNKSFVSAEGYGRSSFRWAMFALILGMTFAFVDVFVSSGAVNMRLDRLPHFCGALAVVMFVLCGLLLLRSMFGFRRAGVVHDKLLELQRTITAIRYLERSKDIPASVDPVVVVARILTPSLGAPPVSGAAQTR